MPDLASRLGLPELQGLKPLRRLPLAGKEPVFPRSCTNMFHCYYADHLVFVCQHSEYTPIKLPNASFSINAHRLDPYLKEGACAGGLVKKRGKYVIAENDAERGDQTKGAQSKDSNSGKLSIDISHSGWHKLHSFSLRNRTYAENIAEASETNPAIREKLRQRGLI